ncbi:MAG: nucleotidyltransferase domain-containing protein [Candidatus Calescibacterium sp.]|nr:nucleotidyltransferase domain-containing protein [Candidatus Calescibacterium sp.]MDW8133349.1 nucleotidyltransferase domain-containing protein [Candidatus Calescibacterium sp.]
MVKNRKDENQVISDIVVEIVKFLKDKDIEVQRILLFGSRVTGKSKTFSDIDIAIETKNSVPFRTRRILKEKIDNVSGIYTADLIFLNDVDNSFREIIIENGQVLYEEN